MQSASDLFLGWTESVLGRHFYVRQLKDMKIKMLVEVYTPSVMRQYAEVCGWCLAVGLALNLYVTIYAPIGFAIENSASVNAFYTWYMPIWTDPAQVEFME